MFKRGDKAILEISFDMIEQGEDYTFDDHEDRERFVRGDMVDILEIVGDQLAVIYSPKTYASTTINTMHLRKPKGTININVPIRVEGAEEAAAKISDALKSMKIEVGDPKVSEKGQLGTDDMRIVGGTIKASHIHTGGMIHGGIKLSF